VQGWAAKAAASPDSGRGQARSGWRRQPCGPCLGKKARAALFGEGKGQRGDFCKKKINSHGGLPEVKMLK
jgi:hypothetical protein